MFVSSLVSTKTHVRSVVLFAIFTFYQINSSTQTYFNPNLASQNLKIKRKLFFFYSEKMQLKQNTKFFFFIFSNLVSFTKQLNSTITISVKNLVSFLSLSLIAFGNESFSQWMKSAQNIYLTLALLWSTVKSQWKFYVSENQKYTLTHLFSKHTWKNKK